MRRLILLLPLCLSLKLFGESFYEGCRYRGFYFFDKGSEKKAEKETLPKPKNGKEARILLKLYGKKMEEAHALAMLDPSEKHFNAYFKWRNLIVDLGSRFATNQEVALLNRPDFGPDIDFATTDIGIEMERKLKAKEEEKDLQDLGKRFFLFVAGNGGEVRSELAAHVGSILKQHVNWEVRFLSLNKKPCQAQISSLFSEKVEEQILKTGYPLTHVPAFFLVSASDENIFPVGCGALVFEQLVENILLQVQENHLLEDPCP